jgi:hypothetical protein
MKTAHLSWKYRRRRNRREEREFREAQSLRARKRWERVGNEGGPVRGVRVVEITIRDSMAPRTIIRAVQREDDEGRWGRFELAGIGRRPVGRRGLGEMVAAAVCPVG